LIQKILLFESLFPNTFFSSNHQEAYKQLEKCLKLDQSDLIAWINLAAYQKQKKESQNSYNTWKRAVKANSNSSDFWFYYGLKCKEMKDYENAIKAFEKSISLEPFKGADEAKFISEISGQPIDVVYKKYLNGLQISIPYKSIDNLIYIPAFIEGQRGWFFIRHRSY